MTDMTDATPTIEEMVAFIQSEVDRGEYFIRKHPRRKDAGADFADEELAMWRAIRDTLSSLSPLIEAARRDALEEAALKADAVADVIMTRADDYHEREEYDLYEELEGQAGVATQIRDDIRALSTFPAPAKE